MRFIVFIILSFFSFFSLYGWAGTVSEPPFSHPKGSIGTLKIHLSPESPAHNFVTTGFFFDENMVFDKKNIIATDKKGKNYPLQLDIFNHYPNGALRFGVLTLDITGAKDIDGAEIYLYNKPSGQIQNSIKTSKASLPNISVEIFTTDGRKKRISIKDAIAEKSAWQKGPLLNVKRYQGKIFKDISIDFDVKKYKDTTARIDIIFHYDRLFETPMQDISYGANIFIDNKLFKKIPTLKQLHHTKWRYPLRFGYGTENHATLDMRALMRMDILPQLDMDFGTSYDKIKTDYHKTVQSQPQNNLSKGLLTQAMGTTGGRDEIALLPQWASRYIISNDAMARYVTLSHGEIASNIPWHYYDAKTNLSALPYDHPKIWLDYRARIDKNNISPMKNNGKWKIDIAHQSSLVYLPFIITGDRYYYDTMKSIYMYNRFFYNPDFGKKGNYRDMITSQIRAVGWYRRASGEMQSILHSKKDPAAFYIKTQNKRDMNYLYKKFVLGEAYGAPKGQTYTPEKGKKITGELQGMLTGYVGPENPLFMQDLSAIAIGFEAGLNLHPWLKHFSKWQSQFISGRFLQKHNGYPPEYAAIYKFTQFIPNPNGYRLPNGKFDILTTWRDVFKHSINDHRSFIKGTKKIAAGSLPDYPDSAAAYTAYARAANAQLFNVTRNPDSLEAYGFLAQYFYLAKKDYKISPAYLIVPRFDNNVPLTVGNIITGNPLHNNLDGSPPFSLVHARDGDDVISLKKNHINGFFFGGDGNDRLYAGHEDDFSKKIPPRSGGSYLYGGDGEDILVSGNGNDTLKGDETYGKYKDIFVFDAHHSGQDIITDFNPKYDFIHICGLSASAPLPSMTQTKKNPRDTLLTFNNNSVLIKGASMDKIRLSISDYKKCNIYF